MQKKEERKALQIKSLAELKRIIQPGTEFAALTHKNHPDIAGLVRVVTEVQSNAYYSVVKDQPEHPFSTCNYGKGFRSDFEKAGCYLFDGSTIKVLDSRRKDGSMLYEMEIYGKENTITETEETDMNEWESTRRMAQRHKEAYPPGTRIELVSMDDPYAPVPSGTRGTVVYVDDMGQLGMNWDNGRRLSLIPGKDAFRTLTAEELAEEQQNIIDEDSAPVMRM